MKITKATNAYDATTSGKPWIGTVSLDPFNQVDRPDFNPRGFVGKEGEAGELTIEAEAGDVVAFGRKPKEGKGQVFYAIVQEDGSLNTVDRKAAGEHLKERRAAGHITAAETCRASATVNAVIKRFKLTPEQFSDAGVTAQKEALSEAAKARHAQADAGAEANAGAGAAPGI